MLHGVLHFESQARGMDSKKSVRTSKNLAVRPGISKSSALFKKKKNVPWMPSMLVPKICHHVKYQPIVERRAPSAEPLQ